MDISEEEKAKIREKVEKLKNSRFKQQTLPAWRPIPSFRSTMITFTVFGVIFLGLGILLYAMSDQIREEIVTNYDDREECKKNLYKPCQDITFEIKQDIQGPIYVYYQLDNFYQNHRRYVKSRSFNQLKGDYFPADQLTDCNPIQKNSDLMPQITAYKSGKQFDENDKNLPAIPCGLVAKSFFNDTYTLIGPNGKVDILETNIAWESDKQYKFRNIQDRDGKNWTHFQWQNMEDEHFIVWMRTAGLPNFRKLWGRIEGNLKAGIYTLKVVNNYDVNGFDGNKSFVLSTTNALGGKNYFLAICYIVVGSLCLIFAVIFLVAFLKKKNSRRTD